MPQPAPTQRCRGNSCGGSSSTRQGVACDHAESPEFTADSLPWHPPAGMADAHPPRRQAVIADVRHVRNGTGRYCTLRGYGQGQAHLPAASGNHDVKPGRLYSRRPHRLHHPALRPLAIFRGTSRGSMSCTPGNQTPAEPVSSGSRARPLLNCPSRRSTAISQTGRGRNTRIDSIVFDRTTGSRMPVQHGGAQPTPLRRPRVGT